MPIRKFTQTAFQEGEKILTRFFGRIWQYIKDMDKLLFLLILVISTYSLLLLKSVSRASDTNYFKTQLMAVVLGLVGAWILTLIDYSAISSFWYLIAGFSIFLMVYTMLFGISIQNEDGVNAKAWINLGFTTFQSSELVKIAFMITFAKHLTLLKERELMKKFLHVALLGVHALIPMGLCVLQGDTGAAVIFFCMFLAMSFVAGVQLRYFAGLFGALLVAAPLAWKYFLEEYQKKRFTAVYNLDDPIVARGDGYQQYQGRLSIGSGQFWGRGLFEGPRVESNRVTFQQSDFIFSVAGEELGFVGCVLIIALLVLLLLRTVHNARVSRDPLGTYICMGFFGMIASQAIFNIGMCLAVLPVMGVTLPFFSAGGSSAACLYFGYGLVQNVYLHHKEVDGFTLRRNR